MPVLCREMGAQEFVVKSGEKDVGRSGREEGG